MLALVVIAALLTFLYQRDFTKHRDILLQFLIIGRIYDEINSEY